MDRNTHGEQASGPKALSLEGLTHRYGNMVAVNDVSLGIAPGEIVCLCGPSGCGKSTLLRLAAGLETVQAGRVRIAGTLVADANAAVPPERRGVGLVFQDYALFPHLSVFDNVRFGLSSRSGAERRDRALETLRQVGMEDYAKAFPHQLSGGQQQRVALARALAPEPAVVLLDEPFSGLDARLRDQVRDETLTVLRRNGTATMLVTHDPEEAMYLADRIVLMRDGRMIQMGGPPQLYTQPGDPFVASFFGEVNRMQGRVVDGQVASALGSFAAPGLPEGSDALILVRPEAIKPAQHTNALSELTIKAVVTSARMLGRDSLVYLELIADKTTVKARIPGQISAKPGSVVSLDIAQSQVFIFAA